MKSLFNTHRIILASKSPRRHELLRMADIPFEVHSKDVAEIHPQGIPKEEIPLALAQLKAEAFTREIEGNDIVIGADTIVLQNGVIYEKPSDRADAINMLQQLSGHSHTVITGVCILTTTQKVTFSEQTKVHFNPLTIQQIEYYVDHYKPYDKAGSYACQEWIGAVGIKAFEGDYFNVVGLPVNRVYRELLNLIAASTQH